MLARVVLARMHAAGALGAISCTANSNAVLAIGQAHFPDDPQMVLAFANFLISIKKSHQTGSSLLQHVSKLEDVSLGDQFIVFVRME
eukprot:1145218-Pelagomonas_calceolata.AAC.1